MKTKSNKTRYISVKNEGDEIYIENIPVSGSLQDHESAAKLRLREIERVMPYGKWSITIEEHWKENGKSHYQILDIATGKIEEVCYA